MVEAVKVAKLLPEVSVAKALELIAVYVYDNGFNGVLKDCELQAVILVLVDRAGGQVAQVAQADWVAVGKTVM